MIPNINTRCIFVGIGLDLYHHASEAPFTNVIFANVVGREDLSGIDMAGRRVEVLPWLAAAMITCDFS